MIFNSAPRLTTQDSQISRQIGAEIIMVNDRLITILGDSKNLKAEHDRVSI